MTELKKGKQLNEHVKLLCEELKELLMKKEKEKAKPKHPVDEHGFPLNDSIGG